MLTIRRGGIAPGRLRIALARFEGQRAISAIQWDDGCYQRHGGCAHRTQAAPIYSPSPQTCSLRLASSYTSRKRLSLHVVGQSLELEKVLERRSDTIPYFDVIALVGLWGDCEQVQGRAACRLDRRQVLTPTPMRIIRRFPSPLAAIVGSADPRRTSVADLDMEPSSTITLRPCRAKATAIKSGAARRVRAKTHGAQT